MKKMSKFLSIVLSLIMVVSFIPIAANADETVTSGTCGDNITWEYDEYTSTLTLSGEGEMYQYDYYFNASNDEADDRPWGAYSSFKIKNIIISEGITTISENAFNNFRYLCFVTIPSSLTRIEDYAFVVWDEIMAVNYLGSEEEWNNIDIGYGNADLYNSEKFYFKDDYVPVSDSGTCGDNLTWTFDASTFTLTFFGIGDMDGFLGNDGSLLLQPNKFDGWRPWEDYEFEVKKVVISDGITSIGKNAFAMFINLECIEIPDSLTKIGCYSFGYCINLTDVYYSGTEEEWNNITIGDFLGNFNEPLDNATIHYNYHAHNYDNIITPPTCTEQGYTTYTCECGDTYIDDFVDENGHSHETVITPPTCTEQGYTTYTCECGDTYINDYVNATGHSYGEWTVIKEATVDAEGEMERVCTCGENEYKSIDKLPAVEDNNTEQENTNKDDIKNPEIPDTDSEVASSVYSLFMLASFACAIAYIILVCRRRCK